MEGPTYKAREVKGRGGEKGEGGFPRLLRSPGSRDARIVTGHDFLYQHAKLGEIELRAPARSENWFLVCHAWSASVWGT